MPLSVPVKIESTNLSAYIQITENPLSAVPKWKYGNSF
jgi:hypothetical protein